MPRTLLGSFLATPFVMCSLLGTALAGGPPDSTQSTVTTPTSSFLRVCPGTGSGFDDDVVITVRDSGGDPVANSSVIIDLSDCTSLCLDGGGDGLTGTTDANGELTLDPSVGGCESCDVEIRADGVVLGTFPAVRSPDFDGARGTGIVDQCDLDYFFAAVGSGDLCADLNDDLAITIVDLGLASAALGKSATVPCDSSPSSALSSAEPWDSQGYALVVPGTDSVDDVTVTVRDSTGALIGCADVEIDFSDCSGLCVDSPDGLTGVTDGSGTVTLNPSVGGCDSCTVNVLANGVIVASHDWLLSPDFDRGYGADGKVDSCDELLFAEALGAGDACADQNGDGSLDIFDISAFGGYLAGNHTNAQTCDPPPVDTTLSSVEPWDTYGQAFVSPGTQSGVDVVTVTTRDSTGATIACVDVLLDFSDCSALCFDEDAGVTGLTDSGGEVKLDPRIGGCATCEVIVWADGTVLRTYPRVVSLDWDGLSADGQVDNVDRAFAVASIGTQDACADYNGSGTVDLVDVDLSDDGQGDSNAESCSGTAVPVLTPALRGSLPLLTISRNPTAPGEIVHGVLYVPTAGPVELRAFDVSGREIEHIWSGFARPGNLAFEWLPRDRRNAALASGIYFLRASTAAGPVVRKVTLLR